MAFLFDKKTRNAMRGVWIFFSIIIILSMVLVFSGGSQGAFTGAPSPQSTQQEQTLPSAEDITITPTNSSSSENTPTVQKVEVNTQNDSLEAEVRETESDTEFEAQF